MSILKEIEHYWTQIITNHSLPSVARQIYKTDASQEYVIQGNDVIVKCQYPSFVSDFLSVTGWEDSEGSVYESSLVLQSGNYLLTHLL